MSLQRLLPHQIDTAGASDGDGLVYDESTDTYGPGTISGSTDMEAVQDIIGAALVAGTGVSLSYDDPAGTITITATGGGGTTDAEVVRDTIAAALVAGANVTITPDDAGDTITIAVSGLGTAATKNVGTTSGTVAAGDDSRLSDSRTPTAHKTTHATGGTDALAPSDIGAVPTTRSVAAGTGLTGGGALSADRTLTVDFGTGAGKVTQGNDSRLSDSRTPTAHASSHAAAGSDAIAIDDSQVSAVAPNDQTGTTYTFAMADKHRMVRVSNASAITVTVPANASVAYPKGTVLTIAQQGAGQITLVGNSSPAVTLRQTHGLKTSAQYAMVQLVKVDTDEWYVSGDTTT